MTLTPITATQAILAAFVAGWNVADTGAEIFDGERGSPVAGEPYLRVWIRDLPTARVTLGAVTQRLAEQRGLVIAQVFAPNAATDGAVAALTLAQAFRDLLHGQTIGEVRYQAANVQRIGADRGFYQVNVTIPFAYDERI